MADLLKVDLTPLAEALAAAGQEVVGAINVAVRLTAAQVQSEWQEQVYRALPLRDPWTRARSEAAVASIKATDTGPFESVVSSDNDAVAGLENGVPAVDMKLWPATSPRAKVTAKGTKFLTIPFRHNTPGSTATAPAMPRSVYDAARGLGAAQITGRKLRVNAHGDPVPAYRYLWSSSLSAGHAPKLKPEHRTDPYAGMVRMETSTKGKKSSAYLTFRTLSGNSPAGSWIIPAKPAQYIAQDLAERAQATLIRRAADIITKIGI
jgi:hypothetical protein